MNQISLLWKVQLSGTFVSLFLCMPNHRGLCFLSYAVGQGKAGGDVEATTFAYTTQHFGDFLIMAEL